MRYVIRLISDLDQSFGQTGTPADVRPKAL
jgi:hypothetical protein